MKRRDGTVNANPTSGGGDHFLDFIQKELMPQIEKRYRTSCYRVFAGHSLGGLMVIHTLITRLMWRSKTSRKRLRRAVKSATLTSISTKNT